MRSLSRFAVSLLALATLVLVAVGIPAALLVLVGNPLPEPMPTGAELGDMAAGRAPIPADLLISVLAGVMWLIWAQVAWATLIETLAASRGRLARRAHVLPGLQLGVGKLVTATTLLATSFSARPVAAGPLMPVVVATQPEEPAPPPDRTVEDGRRDALAREAPKLQAYTTAQGDTWWGIAEDTFGVGTRWKEIRNLNLGRTMEDGSVISVSTDLLRPQWRLLLPGGDGAVVLTTAGGAGQASGGRASGGVAHALEARDVIVERGDTIWGLAEEDLQVDEDEPSVGEVVDLVAEISDLNQAELNGNPDLIFPGQRLALPPLPDPSETDPGTTADAFVGSADAPASPAEQEPDPGSDAPADAPDESAGPGSDASAGAPEESAGPGSDASAGAPEESAGPGSDASAGAPEESAAPGSDASADAPAGPPSPLSPAGPEVPSPPQLPTTTMAGAPTEPSPSRATIQPEGGTTAPDDQELSLAGVEASAVGATPSTDGASDELATAAPAGVTTATEAPSPTGEVRPGDQDIVAQATGPISLDLTDDLPTVGTFGVDETAAANGSPGDAEGLETGESRAPIFIGLAAMTLVGGYLYRARGRRRKTALQSRHAGRRPQPPKRRTRPVARRLAAAAEPEHPEFVNIGLRALGRLLQDVPAAELPKISGVWVSHNRLVLALADDSPRRCPPAPFTEFADGSGWSLHRSKFDEVRKVARGANGPLPLLTTVGTTTALDLALTTNSRAPAEAYGLESSLLFAVDLEAGRVISVRSPHEAPVVETLTMMALELATSETADQAEIVCVGFGHRLATFERIQVVDDLSSIMDDLEEVASRAVYAAGDATPFATRVGNGAADTWNPVVVFHANPDDPDVGTLIELAEMTDGGVTAVCGYETGSGWTFLVDGDRISCPDLPGNLAQHEFLRPELDGVELIADLFDEPWGEIDLDERFWDPLDPVDPDPEWDAYDTADHSWRPMPTVSEPDHAGAGSELQPAAGPPEDLGNGAPPPAGYGVAQPRVEHEVPPPIKALRHSVEHTPFPGTERTFPERSAPAPGAESSPVGDRGTQPGTAPPHTDRSAPSPGTEPASTEPPAETPGGAGVGPAASPQPGAAGRATPGPGSGPPPVAPGIDGLPSRSRHLYVVDGAPTGSATTEVRVSVADTRSEDARYRPPTPGESASGQPGSSSTSLDQAAASGHRVDGPGGHGEVTDVRVSVLGNLMIEGHHTGDRRKPWKYTKTPELILYLLLHPGGASQDLLMEQLFPEQPPNRPRLNQLVSDARTKALGLNRHGEYHLPHASPTEPFYRLQPSVGFDLRDFAQHCANARRAETVEAQAREWQAALELVRGRPFTLPHDGYEWALPEVEATIVKVEEAAVALADLAVELGDHQLAVWATKQGLLTGTGYYELLVRRGRAALMLQDPEEIVRAFADLQVSLDYTGAPEEGMPDLSYHPELEDVYNELSSEGRGRDRSQ